MPKFPDLTDEEDATAVAKDAEKLLKSPTKVKKKKKLKKSNAVGDSFETPKLSENYDTMVWKQFLCEKSKSYERIRFLNKRDSDKTKCALNFGVLPKQ